MVGYKQSGVDRHEITMEGRMAGAPFDCRITGGGPTRAIALEMSELCFPLVPEEAAAGASSDLPKQEPAAAPKRHRGRDYFGAR